MDNDLKIILEFLARCGAEVEGHAATEPEMEEAQLLLRFARGSCSPEERSEACEMIQLHPAWLRWISDRVKAVRFDAPPTVNDKDSHSAS